MVVWVSIKVLWLLWIKRDKGKKKLYTLIGKTILGGAMKVEPIL